MSPSHRAVRTVLPSWQFVLGPTQIWDLAAYVKSLSVPAPSAGVANSHARAPVSSHEVAAGVFFFLRRRIGGVHDDLGLPPRMARCAFASAADPNNLPFSDQGRPRFREQDRRADCERSRLDRGLHVVGATARLCEAHAEGLTSATSGLGVASGAEMMTSTPVRTTGPSYVFVTRADRGPAHRVI